MKLKNKTGMVFGRLTVLIRISGTGEPARFLCECSCGNQIEVFGGNLGGKGSRTESCGCLHKERVAEAKQFRPYEASYNGFRYRAGRRGLVNDISYEDFLEFTKQIACHYCDEPVIWTMFNGNNKAYNLDRKDNSQGYLKANVVVSCSRCNRSKANRYTYEEWLCMTKALKTLKQKFNRGMAA